MEQSPAGRRCLFFLTFEADVEEVPEGVADPTQTGEGHDDQDKEKGKVPVGCSG